VWLVVEQDYGGDSVRAASLSKDVANRIAEDLRLKRPPEVALGFVVDEVELVEDAEDFWHE
jgi:hypothetical protein